MTAWVEDCLAGKFAAVLQIALLRACLPRTKQVTIINLFLNLFDKQLTEQANNTLLMVGWASESCR